MVQSRRPAGTPVGGQFASVNRPGTRLSLVDGEGDDGRGGLLDALAQIDRDGAIQAAKYERVGHVLMCVPASARGVVSEAIDGGVSWPAGGPEIEELDRLTDVAIYRAACLIGIDRPSLDGFLRTLPSQMKTDIWRSARYQVRQAIASDGQAPTGSATAGQATTGQATTGQIGQRSWVCPVDASHATVGQRCTTCGIVGIANAESAESVPPSDERGGVAADAFAPRPRSENRIDPASLDWTYCGYSDEPGGEAAAMLGTAYIGTTPFHVLALQVQDSDGIQRALQRDDDLSQAMDALGDEAPYATVEVDGREYVFLISPHAR
jgi:hypothetical protein